MATLFKNHCISFRGFLSVNRYSRNAIEELCPPSGKRNLLMKKGTCEIPRNPSFLIKDYNSVSITVLLYYTLDNSTAI